MTYFAGSNQKNKLVFSFYLLAFLCAAVAVIYAALYISLEDTRLKNQQPVILQAGWSVRTAEGNRALQEPSRPAADCVGKDLCLVNRLPYRLQDGQSLCFQTKNESVRVWVEDILVYTYGELPQRVYGHGVGAVWHLADLPDNSAGQSITVELIPIGGRTGLAPYGFFIDDHGGAILYLLRQNLDMLTVFLVLALIGLTVLLIALIGAVQHRQWSLGSLFNFAVFVLLSALWTAADSGLLQFVNGNKGVSYLLFGCSFYLLCTPLALFMSTVQPEHARLYRGFSLVNSVYAIVRIALYAGGLVDFEAALWLLHIFMGVFITTVNLTIWLPVLRRKKTEMPEMCLAVTSFMVIAGVSLVDFYLRDKLDVQRCDYSSGFYVGILLFVLIALAGSMRQARIMRQKAFKADFFERRAYTDELTSLLNVRGFDDKCTEVLREAKSDDCYGVVDFDVNFFSQYNANNGLQSGDELLRSIAARLREICCPGELCARQEADHFVCLLKGASLESVLSRIKEADKAVRESVSQQMLLLSYGVAPVTEGILSPASLRNQALVAKRTVKGNYEDNIAVYDRQLHERQLREMALLSGFEAALLKGEYFACFQPKIDPATNCLGGAEALARHIEDDGTITSVGLIIDSLEQKGFVTKLDYYIFEEVCKFLRRNLDEGRDVCPISSNFSRVHLYNPDFVSRVAAIADKYSLPHQLLEIELTETVFLTSPNVLRSVVQGLHSCGFKVSIDDFGSGYSSLNILMEVAVDVLKLDRDFLIDMEKNTRAVSIVEHIIGLAQTLGIRTVAEGVETAEQLAFMRRLNCDLVQGYYYSCPLPAEEFIASYLA